MGTFHKFSLVSFLNFSTNYLIYKRVNIVYHYWIIYHLIPLAPWVWEIVVFVCLKICAYCKNETIIPSQTCVISPKKLNDKFKFIAMIGIFFSLKMKNKWPAFFFHFCNFPPNARKMKRMFFSLKMKSEWPAFIFHFCNFS